MNIADKEIVDRLVDDPKKAGNQILRSDLKPTDLTVPGNIVGSKSKEVKLGALSAVDLKLHDFYETIDPDLDQRNKEFKSDAVPMLRWLSCVGEPDWDAWRANAKKGPPPMKDSKLTEEYLLLTNEVVNVGFWDLMNEPKLQYLLMTVVGCGKKINHQWIPMPKKRARTNALDALLNMWCPGLKDDDIELLKEINTWDDIEELCKSYGMQDSEIKVIKEEYKKSHG